MKYQFVCGLKHEVTLYYNADNYNDAISHFLRDFDGHKLPITVYAGFDIYVSNKTTNHITATLHPHRDTDRINISSFAD